MRAKRMKKVIQAWEGFLKEQIQEKRRVPQILIKKI